ncbi:xanthine dehydrogenase family protein molybdopterin-binding subunit [Novibacillus thermophilus]|uniref:Carbon monoxide dehydrogenase n=1 Tax=Novibacillus thermophilus TaxID=1471761 RepID=A0A1U9K801_9BACL|nr:molybdopterin cofactor-binding domain-containing protein [Novibacillus thermophilus]AQS56150.1 carbon monoxide dehydrogenase [Novibacillus thermophilus]
MANIFGTPLKRREDPRLVTGNGSFTDDIRFSNALYAVMLRSPHAHAHIKSIDASKAKQADGVVAVYTGRDVQGKMEPIPTAWLPPDSNIQTPAHPALAVDKVRYVGDAVAMVIAEDRYAARDALDLIEVEYEPLPVVVDQEKAMADTAPLLHEDVPNNLAYHWRAGEVADDVFEKAEVVVRQRFRQQRLIPNPMEMRAAAARYNPASGEMTIWCTSQNPHIHRFILSGVLGIPESKLQIVATDVGGGFGSKIAVYPDEALVGFAARELRRPVKWTEDRSEHFTVTSHGRDVILDVELAGKRDGTLEALKIKNIANMGAYLSTAAPGVETILFGLITPGPYKIRQAQVDTYGVFTNTTPTDAYRGAGRPEATYLIERMVDLFAEEIGMDPVEIRRRNLIEKDEFPYDNALGLQYDSGDYKGALDKVLNMLDYDKFREEQERARQQGKYLGVGFSTYVEICGLGPSKVAGAVGFQGGLWESATVRVHPTGKVSVFTGTSPHGQGEETTFAQIVADKFGIQAEDIEVIHGDTNRISMGWGTYGSRTTPVGGTAIAIAADRVLEKAKKIAAHALEVAEEDLDFRDGAFQVKGVPDKAMSFADVSLQASVAWNLPEGMEPSLEAQAFYDPDNFVYPFGAHACVVEIDSETGEIEIKRYLAVDDPGPVINPMVAEGQVHGGIVQGIGQALWEGAVYDGQGQLLSGTFMDYAMPKARFFPKFETAFTETPSPVNPLGVKGIGETGTIAATPAVVNAVIDALKPFGVKELEMPLTPEKIWNVLKRGRVAQ